MEKEALNAQREHWEETFAEKAEMFGLEPSDPARKAVDIFKKEGKKKILELGCGQGRGLTNNWGGYIITYEQVFI